MAVLQPKVVLLVKHNPVCMQRKTLSTIQRPQQSTKHDSKTTIC
jgi:hypothetical protein